MGLSIGIYYILTISSMLYVLISRLIISYIYILSIIIYADDNCFDHKLLISNTDIVIFN